MPSMWMDVDAALSEVPINIAALIDDTDFKTREQSVTYDQSGLDLLWNFVTTAGAFTQTAVTPTDTGGDYDFVNQGNGMYTIEIPASSGASINNDTEGHGWFSGFATGILPWIGPVIGFRAAALNNALIDGGDNLDVSLTHVMGTSLTEGGAGRLAAAIVKLFDVATPTLVASDVMRGTNSAALASLFTGITSVAEWLGLLAGKQAGDATAVTEIKATGAGSGTYNPTTDSGEALRDTAPMGSAMVGTDSAALASVCTETRLAALTDWLNGGRLDSLLDAIKAVTDLLPDAGALSDLATLLARLSATRAGKLDSLLAAGSVASQTEVLAIQNNTRTTIAVPGVAERPDAGATRIKIYLNNYDTAGNMEAPDSAPTVAVENEEGTTRSGNLQHPTAHGAQTTMVLLEAGRYWIEYDLDNADALENLTFSFTVIEGGVTRKLDRSMLIVDTTAVDFTAADRTKLDTLHDARCTEARMSELDAGTGGKMANDVGLVLVDTADMQPKLGTPATDLAADIAAVKTETALIVADTNELQTDWKNAGRLDALVDAIKAATDQLVFSTANQVDANVLAINSSTAAAIRLALASGQIIPFTVDTAVNSHTPTATEFQAADITQATADHFNGRHIIFISGALAGQETDIVDPAGYTAVGGIGQFTVTAMTGAPAHGNVGIII